MKRVSEEGEREERERKRQKKREELARASEDEISSGRRKNREELT